MPQFKAAATSSPALSNSSIAIQGGNAALAPDDTSQSQQGPQHKRVYQACIPCRRRKVRCDLGSVDNPHDPPCVRCRRESKECFFSATRRKRKTEDGEGSDEEYIIRNGRKRLRAESATPPRVVEPPPTAAEAPLTPGGSYGRSKPLRRPDTSDRSDSGIPQEMERRHSELDGEAEGDANQTLENLEAQTALRRGLYGPHDALDLLYKAATDRSVAAMPPPWNFADMSSPALSHRREESTASPMHSAPPSAPSANKGVTSDMSKPTIAPASLEQPVDPGLAQSDVASQPGYIEALKAWARFRFVRAGWFTAQEAIEYIDYYYKYLSPMTPISPPTFSNPASHVTLLTEEPILSVTLLTIASRYRKMTGAGGHCRSHAIHEQLWTYLRGMIERCLWGQEAFGGGFCHSGPSFADEAQTSSTAPWRGMRKGSLRTFGTIESLLILTEWHPRALHFPPQDATDELMLPNYSGDESFGSGDDPNRNMGATFGGKRIESWLEPAWRSDRMSWMLLSTAMGLGYELGVFDDIEEMLKDGAITRPEYREENYRQRANRIKRLLVIYTSQLAGRLNWTSMSPEHIRKSDPAISRRRPNTTTEGNTPGTNQSSVYNGFVYIPDAELDDQVIHCWAGISNLMHIGTERLFRSRQHTSNIIQTGKYVDLLREVRPLLHDWKKEFERYRLPPFTRHILTIEYEYVRIYVNSLPLQAVVERCATSNATNGVNGHMNHGTNLSPQTLINYGKLPLGQLGGFTVHDQEVVREVVDGSRNLLRTVVEGLLPGDYLKHAPVRTYFRIISGAMFLLKTFALGAPRSDVKLSIDLMDATVEALRNCVVDDVHLGIRYADLLETLTSRLRNRFIQAPTIQQTEGSRQSPAVEHGTSGAAGGGVALNGDANSAWSGNHAQKVRDGLDGHYHMPTPIAEGNNISATPFDLSTGNFPYPGGSSMGPSTPAPNPDTTHNPNAAPGTGMDVSLFDDWNNPGNEMWYLPTGPAFFQNMENSSVAMTSEGVNVGGLDLLEYMAMDPVHFSNAEGGGSGGAGGQPGSGSGI